MKKLIAVLLSLIILASLTVPAFASEIEPYSNNVSTTVTSFTITAAGVAIVENSYTDSQNRVQSAKIETKVQRKVGLLWITVSGGSWVDITTEHCYIGGHSVQLTKKDTYRAHVEYTISGTGGSDDKITKNLEYVYS